MSGSEARALELDLPRPPGVIRTFFREHPRWMDAVLTAVYLLITAGMAVVGAVLPEDLEDPEAPLEWVTPEYFRMPQILLLLLIVGITIAAIFLRRRFPITSLVVVLAALVFGPEDMVPLGSSTFAVGVLLYSIPVYRSVRAGWLGYAIAVVGSLLPIPFMSDVVTAELNTAGEAVTLAITSSLLLLVPVVIGINAGNRRRYTAAIIDRAHQLARERDQRARLAVAEERTRIAREMHDIVAHSVSVMVTLSEGAAHVIEAAPGDARNAMEQSAETGRAALTEMRSLIGALREDTDSAAELAPTPGLSAVPELIQSFRAAGLTVHVTLTGAASHAGDGSEKSRELAIYRTIQEALTNTLRYAGPNATARVVVEQGPPIRVLVEDDGGVPGQVEPMRGVGSGHGLMGLAERLRVVGGELEYGPLTGGGWRVSAVFPTRDEESGS